MNIKAAILHGVAVFYYNLEAMNNVLERKGESFFSAKKI